MRPKLLAIKVSGGHLVPMILRASSRGHQARARSGSRSRPPAHQAVRTRPLLRAL